ncbi:MAG: hydantoinase/carbamoylase family amidase [Gaiellaceae bacterium]
MATIDRAESTARVATDVDELTGSDYTLVPDAIRRYAYTDAYKNTLDYFEAQFRQLGFDVSYDPVGTLVARNRPVGEPVFGIGSHCDSNRNGGPYDGTLGVVVALEICRLNAEHGTDLPLQVISFLEEEGSAFAQMLLGSRIMVQRVVETDLRERFIATDDGRTFWEHAKEAGYEPERWRESSHVLDDLTGWIETHIEQARVLQDTQNRLGIVNAIAGYIHGDITVTGRSDHAGATPMDFRNDAAVVAALCVSELERLAVAAGSGTVGTVGELDLSPGIINVVPGGARLSLDVRGPVDELVANVIRDITEFAERTARERGLEASFAKRQTFPATPMDARIVAALESAGAAAEQPFRTMPSGAAHDTMCVADRVPSAMVFVPCRDGISHAPDEEADPADGALAAEVIFDAIQQLI